MELFQWDDEFDKEEVCEELADILIYSLLLANELDVDVEEIVLRKLEINKNKYPIEKFKGISTKYNKL